MNSLCTTKGGIIRPSPSTGMEPNTERFRSAASQHFESPYMESISYFSRVTQINATIQAGRSTWRVVVLNRIRLVGMMRGPFPVALDFWLERTATDVKSFGRGNCYHDRCFDSLRSNELHSRACECLGRRRLEGGRANKKQTGQSSLSSLLLLSFLGLIQLLNASLVFVKVAATVGDRVWLGIEADYASLNCACEWLTRFRQVSVIVVTLRHDLALVGVVADCQSIGWLAS